VSIPPPGHPAARPRHPMRQRTSHGIVRALAVVATVVAVAAGTTAIVRLTPAQLSPSSGPGGPYRTHPVVITLPDHPASYLGAYARGVPRSYTPIEAFAAGTGVHPNIALYYSGWREPFQTAFAMRAAAHRAIPLIQIEPGTASLIKIVFGAYDNYLKSFATAVASYGAKTKQGVIISFAHEPNGNWYRWGSGHVAPSMWVAAWRHVVNVFRQQGADNVTWLWTVNIIATKQGALPPAPWWPGSSYVTWVGIDGYYYKPSWTFASLFGPTIKAVRALTLDPILISETGAAQTANQPAKITNLFDGIHAYGFLGFVWFNAVNKRDWRLSTPAAISTFRRRAATFQEAVP
jgi:mannan endo-1,4-beta-mannosidase